MELYWKNYNIDRLVSDADTEAVHPPPLSCLVPQLEASEYFDYRMNLLTVPFVLSCRAWQGYRRDHSALPNVTNRIVE